ncbi:MAG: DUF1549 domain-containing protein [Bryobacteraceae bacterium]|nr:DUF1549 domain-containing protein [Bryobacteraceae bacterium]
MRHLKLVWIAPFLLYSAEQTPKTAEKPMREEALSPDRFAEVHAPLFAPNERAGPGEITSRVAARLPEGERIAGAPRRNFVDEHIFGRMERDGVRPAPVSTDYEFLRRVSLDLTGRIPSAGEVREFAADRDAGKREKLIDRLLKSEAFVDKWAYFFMDLFRANGKMGRGQNLFHYWMKENLRVDRPYDEVARAIIGASAKSNHVVAAANVIAREHVQGKAQPDDGEDLGMVQQLDTHDELAILYGKTFLGVNLSCISCHDGRGRLEKVNVWLSKRKRTEFYQFAGFLGRSRYLMYWEDGKPQSGEFLIDDGNPGYDSRGASMIRVPRFGGAASPAFILTGEAPRAVVEPREEMGRMLTAHPQFARAAANMFWWRLMGRGIVEPYDEFDLDRQDPDRVPASWQLQPTHPELLDELAGYFRDNNHRIRQLLRLICGSSAYQLSARYEGEWKDRYTDYFARKFVRLLSAEELHDAITTATGVPGRFKYGNTEVAMSMQLSGPSGGGELKYFMQTFGQSNRNNPPKALSGSPLQPLLLMQSPVVNERVLAAGDSRVRRLLDSYSDDGELVEQMFLGTISRLPTEAERETAMAALRGSRVEGAQNLQWALLNLTEFFYNY